ncbi:MAG: hypothetical protein U0787_10875 [Polyangia bacterium]
MVQGGYYSKPYLTNLPDAPFVVNPVLKVTANVSGLIYDFKTVKVGGQVTLNGATPQTTTANCSTTQNAGYYKARVTFTETTNGYTFYADSLCKDPGYTFAQDIYPGTYKVMVVEDTTQAVPDEPARRAAGRGVGVAGALRAKSRACR